MSTGELNWKSEISSRGISIFHKEIEKYCNDYIKNNESVVERTKFDNEENGLRGTEIIKSVIIHWKIRLITLKFGLDLYVSVERMVLGFEDGYAVALDEILDKDLIVTCKRKQIDNVDIDAETQIFPCSFEISDTNGFKEKGNYVEILWRR